jgi:hypothetical protein
MTVHRAAAPVASQPSPGCCARNLPRPRGRPTCLPRIDNSWRSTRISSSLARSPRPRSTTNSRRRQTTTYRAGTSKGNLQQTGDAEATAASAALALHLHRVSAPHGLYWGTDYLPAENDSCGTVVRPYLPVHRAWPGRPDGDRSPTPQLGRLGSGFSSAIAASRPRRRRLSRQ